MLTLYSARPERMGSGSGRMWINQEVAERFCTYLGLLIRKPIAFCFREMAKASSAVGPMETSGVILRNLAKFSTPYRYIVFGLLPEIKVN